MSTCEHSAGSETQASFWGTFDRVRPQLDRQFDEIAYAPGTGYTCEEMTAQAERYLCDNQNTPRVVQKAYILSSMMREGQITIQPFDIFADKILYPRVNHNHRYILRNVWDRWYKEVEAEKLPYDSAWTYHSRLIGNTMTDLDLGHLSPGWPFVLKQGVPGILEYAKRARAALGGGITVRQADFYQAVEMVYSGLLELLGRYERLALQLARENAGDADRYTVIAGNMRALQDGPPKTLHQALQLIYLVHQMVEMEGEKIRSMGGFDRNLSPFYEADLKAGRLTQEQAKELIKFFWVKFYAVTRGKDNGKNFYFAGQLEDGSDAVTPLSYLAMEAYAELKTPDPKLSVRFTPNTPDAYARLVAQTIRGGQVGFVLTNDEVIVPAMVKRGKTLEDARSHTLIGCYEPAVEGKEIGCNFAILVNLAKGIEFVLNNGVDPLTGIPLGLRTGDPAKMESYEAFYKAFIEQVDHQIGCAMHCVNNLEALWPEINPSPFLAGTFENCLATGKDIGQGGPVYNNSGVTGAFLANAADSLLVVKKLVFEEKSCTMEELVEAVNNDFEGLEPFRQSLVNRVPKFGNNIAEVDDIALDIVAFFTGRVNGVPNRRGGEYQASLYTVEYAWVFGKLTGALPDGRKARLPLAPTLNAMTGRDGGSVTDLINSVTKIDFTNVPNGSVTTINLHPSAVAGEEGLDALVSIVRAFFKKGGLALQFNIFNTETLRDAQEHPEKYPTLQVRVTGWSVYFVTMDEYTQNTFIEEHKYGI